MNVSGVVQPGCHHGESQGEPLANLGAAPGGPGRHRLLDERIQGDCVGDRGSDEIVLEQKLMFSLFSQRDRGDRGHADRFQMASALALVAAFSAAKPLTERGTKVGDEVMLDVDRAFGQVRPVNDAVRPLFDHADAILIAPFVEPKAALIEERVLPVGADPPADVAGPCPLPLGRAEDPEWAMGRFRGRGSKRPDHPLAPIGPLSACLLERLTFAACPEYLGPA